MVTSRTGSLATARWLPLVVLAGVLAVPAVAWSYFAAYRPLHQGTVSQRLGRERPSGGYAVRYRHGFTTPVGQSVRNDGRFPVRVLGIGGDPDGDGYDPWRRLRLHPVGRPDRPLRLPFTLAPGDDVLFVADVPLTFCTLSPGGAKLVLTELPVRWSAFGMTRTTAVPLAAAVHIDGTRNCPRR